MKKNPARFLVGSILGIGLLAVILWFGVLTSAASRSLATRLGKIHELIEPSSEVVTLVSGQFLFSKVTGIPRELAGQGAQFSYQAPDKLFLSAEVDGEKYHIARDGQEVKIFVPHKDMALVGANDVPRFSNRPDSLDPIELPSFALPVSRNLMRLLPAMISAES